MHQTGILEEGSQFHYYSELTVRSGLELAELRQCLASLVQQANALGVHCVVAFGYAFWVGSLKQNAPDGFRSFRGYAGSGFEFPATQGDIFFWLHANRHDALVEAQLAFNHQLASIDVNDGVTRQGFQYADSRDLTGFVDGSANPKEDARMTVALLDGPEGSPGSFVFTQRWVHDLPKFSDLALADQEAVIGRTKSDSIELQGDAMPVDSHVSRTDLKVDGVAQKIYRRSAPVIDGDGAGLYFLAFSCEMSRFETLLQSMLGSNDREVHDQLLE